MPAKYQFEDDMSGEEDAVIDSADTHKTMATSYTHIHTLSPLSVTNENLDESTVDLTLSSHDEHQQQESESTSNVNSDSNSASFF